MTIFVLGGTRAARFMVGWIPSWIIGPIFDVARRSWKAVSKPSKRRGLRDLIMKAEG